MKVMEVDSKGRNGRNGKRKLENHVFQFRMNMRKIRTIVRNETEWVLAAAQKGKSEN